MPSTLIELSGWIVTFFCDYRYLTGKTEEDIFIRAPNAWSQRLSSDWLRRCSGAGFSLDWYWKDTQVKVLFQHVATRGHRCTYFKLCLTFKNELIWLMLSVDLHRLKDTSKTERNKEKKEPDFSFKVVLSNSSPVVKVLCTGSPFPRFQSSYCP